MKKESLKLIIFEGLAALFGILAFSFVFLPAYFENGQQDMSIFDMMVGNERIEGSPIIVLGLVMLILGIVCSIALLVLLLIKKSNDLITTIISITSIVLNLAGAIILTCSIFIVGLDKLNSELGLVQGSWGFLIGNFLVPIMALLSIICSYPGAMIILHHKDLEDKVKKEDKKEDKEVA